MLTPTVRDGGRSTARKSTWSPGGASLRGVETRSSSARKTSAVLVSRSRDPLDPSDSRSPTRKLSRTPSATVLAEQARSESVGGRQTHPRLSRTDSTNAGDLGSSMFAEEIVVPKEKPTIKVCVRCRPFIAEDYAREVSGGQLALCVRMPTKHHVELLSDGESKQIFDFDRCYWSHDKNDHHFVNQRVIYEELGKKMLKHSIGGFNNCIFAYGQTGSGKSFSVLGGRSEAERGLLPRIVQSLFAHFEQGETEGCTCRCLVSFVEIYNEQLRDLLASWRTSGTGEISEESQEQVRRLDVRHHPVLGTVILGLTEAPVESSAEVLKLVQYGEALRAVGETAMNSTSSRSHCIFTFKTTVVTRVGQTRFAHTHLVDLAGSERAKRTEATGDRLREGNMINQSLTTLARVISSLAKKSKGKPPFRDSKLTHILKESLCGNSKTVMIAAISPNIADYNETLSTLKFAQSVKQVKTHAVANKASEKGIEEQLRGELSRLRQKLHALQQEKCADERILMSAQNRLREHEALYSRFGGDWDSMLAAERRRNVHRSAVLNLGVREEQLEELRRKHLEAVNDGSQSSNEDWSGASSGSGCFSGDDVGWKSPTLVYLGGVGSSTSKHNGGDRAVGHADSACGTASERSSPLTQPGALCLRGSAAANFLEDGKRAAAARAEMLTFELQRVASEAEEAEELAGRLSVTGHRRVRLRAMLAVSPTDPSHCSEPLVVVAREQGASGCMRQEIRPRDAEEWLAGPQLRARLAWLRARAKRDDELLPDAWAAAAAAAVAIGGAPRGSGSPLASPLSTTLPTPVSATPITNSRRSSAAGLGHSCDRPERRVSIVASRELTNGASLVGGGCSESEVTGAGSAKVKSVFRHFEAAWQAFDEADQALRSCTAQETPVCVGAGLISAAVARFGESPESWRDAEVEETLASAVRELPGVPHTTSLAPPPSSHGPAFVAAAAAAAAAAASANHGRLDRRLDVEAGVSGDHSAPTSSSKSSRSPSSRRSASEASHGSRPPSPWPVGIQVFV
eukprot:TRINITY_DN8307_c0_g2_i3.p1 TRINITY_DN8307_c0_g2~~TRINITY_DN8307_c0_g2_i3.p1  ORF type:complete len:1026 (-),score=179.05 TRINITY_DN8307_c0_g2_i3:96-3173(-)